MYTHKDTYTPITAYIIQQCSLSHISRSALIECQVLYNIDRLEGLSHNTDIDPHGHHSM